MNPQHGFQRIGRAPTFTLGIMGLDQCQQWLPGDNLIHFDQEALTAGLLTFSGVFGVSEAHLFHAVISKMGCAILPF